jgi:hypothetical protein
MTTLKKSNVFREPNFNGSIILKHRLNDWIEQAQESSLAAVVKTVKKCGEQISQLIN